MARFFIDRPIFAWVLAIIVMLSGVLAIKVLPIAQYPSIAPPAIAPYTPISVCVDSIVTVTDAVPGGSWSTSSTGVGVSSISPGVGAVAQPAAIAVAIRSRQN